MVLKVSFDVTLDSIYESSKVFKILFKKDLEFFLEHENFTKLFPMLMPPKTHFETKKQYCKRYMVWSRSSNYLKMIFALLAEVVAIYT